MTTPHWPRPQWSDSGAHALYVWFLFGEFAEDLSVDARRYRTRGAPDGVDVMRYTHEALRGWEGYPLGSAMGDGDEGGGESATGFNKNSGAGDPGNDDGDYTEGQNKTVGKTEKDLLGAKPDVVNPPHWGSDTATHGGNRSSTGAGGKAGGGSLGGGAAHASTRG